MVTGIDEQLLSIQRASRSLAQSPVQVRNQVLQNLSELLARKQDAILTANRMDLESLDQATPSAFRDRLELNLKRLQAMQESLAEVVQFADPLAEVLPSQRLANGLLLRRVRAPLGVILMIFEARPNVIPEAFSLAFKAGNSLILRGGSESQKTATVLYQLIGEALASAGVAPEVFWGITDPDRTLTQELMTKQKYIDLLIPRGGEGLIQYVSKNATIPIIKNERGLCHVYLHEDADDAMATNIVVNAKTSRPGVCNAMETLLIHRQKMALLPALYERLSGLGVQWYGCPETLKVLKGKTGVAPVGPSSFDTEYLDLKINCRIVSSLQEALDHIQTHGSRHSECIVTATEKTARTFQQSVDAAVVFWNASTRFTDGHQFGLGGEMGVSTQKLHVRGPVGLNELTCLRWVVDGSGQTRA